MKKILLIYSVLITTLFCCILLKKSCETQLLNGTISNLEKIIKDENDELNNVKLNLEAASFYVNIVDSIVFLGMSEMNLIKLFTYDTTCLLEKEENVIFDIHSNCTYDYVYSFDYLDAYFLIKDKKVVRTYNDWSYSYGLEIPYYLKTKKRIGYD